jgi:hypothetical protein
MLFRDGSDKGPVNVHQILCDDVTILFRVINGDKSWICSYGPETEQQSSHWKSPYSPRQVKVRQVTRKVKSMLIIFFDIKGMVYKESVLAGQTVNSAYYSVLR